MADGVEGRAGRPSSLPTRQRPLRARPVENEEEALPTVDTEEPSAARSEEPGEETPARLSSEDRRPGRIARWSASLLLPAFFAPRGPGVIYLGIVTTLTGFALLGVTWGQVAGIGDVVFQLPYLVSGGFTGLGLVLVGLVTISIGSHRREAAERARQMERLAAVLRDVTERLTRSRSPDSEEPVE